jgi:hypothetical protein
VAGEMGERKWRWKRDGGEGVELKAVACSRTKSAEGRIEGGAGGWIEVFRSEGAGNRIQGRGKGLGFRRKGAEEEVCYSEQQCETVIIELRPLFRKSAVQDLAQSLSA